MPRVTGLRKSLATKFDDELRFFKGWIDKPKSVGAIVPTSAITARRMASVADPGSGLPVLETGPGTGVITRAILERGVRPENLYAVEYSTDFVDHLRRQYPGVTVIQGDAFDLDYTLDERQGARHEPFAAVISGLPLLNFPMPLRHRLLENATQRLLPGGVFVQFSYGLNAPVTPPPGHTVTRAAFVWANVPPARVWVYRKA